MEAVSRIWFTPKQRTELWERRRSGQCVADCYGSRLCENTSRCPLYDESFLSKISKRREAPSRRRYAGHLALGEKSANVFTQPRSPGASPGDP
jgi:hypothetical protein